MHKYLSAMTMAILMPLCFADIHRYVNREDDSYQWKEKGVLQPGVMELELHSQTWQNILWKHRLYMVVPPEICTPTPAMLWITGSRYSTSEISQAQEVARRASAPVFLLLDVPNQPLFGNLEEDALVSYTFEQTLRTKDPDWILLFPMTKSAVRAMDAAQSYYREKYGAEISGFVVTGASKRGWTTWLTACVDSRVRAIVPMVYDNLNLRTQMRHQIETWGKYSEKICDYTEKGLPQILETEQGQRLAHLVDPYEQRERLTMPKIMVIATNDRYWTLDALNFYYSQLPGEKHPLYIPNAGHGIRDRERILCAMSASLLWCKGKFVFPQFTWSFYSNGDSMEIALTASDRPQEIKLWQAHSLTMDFREAQWYSLSFAGETQKISLALPPCEHHAMYVEAIFEISGVKFHSCSTVHIARQVLK